MAEMIRPLTGIATMIKIGKRYIRLCLQIPGGKAFAERMKRKVGKLEAMTAAIDEKSEDVQFALDIARLQFALLADEARNAADDIRRFDRRSMSLPLYKTLLPKGLKSITCASYRTAPTNVEELAATIEEFGSDHPLARLGRGQTRPACDPRHRTRRQSRVPQSVRRQLPRYS